MKNLTPSDRAKIMATMMQTRADWDKARFDKRARFLNVLATVETLIFLIADSYGHKHAWEWLQTMADQLMDEVAEEEKQE